MYFRDKAISANEFKKSLQTGSVAIIRTAIEGANIDKDLIAALENTTDMAHIRKLTFEQYTTNKLRDSGFRKLRVLENFTVPEVTKIDAIYDKLGSSPKLYKWKFVGSNDEVLERILSTDVYRGHFEDDEPLEVFKNIFNYINQAQAPTYKIWLDSIEAAAIKTGVLIDSLVEAQVENLIPSRFSLSNSDTCDVLEKKPIIDFNQVKFDCVPCDYVVTLKRINSIATGPVLDIHKKIVKVLSNEDIILNDALLEQLINYREMAISTLTDLDNKRKLTIDGLNESIERFEVIIETLGI